jgi:hypothetical protein
VFNKKYYLVSDTVSSYCSEATTSNDLYIEGKVLNGAAIHESINVLYQNVYIDLLPSV